MRPSKPIKFRVTRDIHAAITDAPVSLSHALRSGILETVPEDILRPAGREDDRTRRVHVSTRLGAAHIAKLQSLADDLGITCAEVCARVIEREARRWAR